MIDDSLNITSRDNPRFRLWLDLLTRKGRRKEGLFIIEGRRVISAALKAGLRPKSIIVRNNYEPSSEDLAAIDRQKTPASQRFTLPPALFNELSSKETPQGIMAVVPLMQNFDWRTHEWKWVSVLADSIQDPRNLGMLIRTADAAGAEALFLGGNCVDLCHPTAVAASMGSVFNLRIYRDVTTTEAMELARRKGVLVAATSGRGTTEAIPWTRAVRPPAVILLGNEGSGLPQEITDKSDVVVRLPIFGQAESLNVAVAAGVLLYMLRTDAPPKCSGICKTK